MTAKQVLGQSGTWRRRLLAATPAAAALVALGAPIVVAQQTYVIGGSGRLPVEINLEAIPPAPGVGFSGMRRQLRIPGTDRLPGSPIVLHAPGAMSSSGTAGGSRITLTPPPIAPAPPKPKAPETAMAPAPSVAPPPAPVARAPAPPPAAPEPAPSPAPAPAAAPPPPPPPPSASLGTSAPAAPAPPAPPPPPMTASPTMPEPSTEPATAAPPPPPPAVPSPAPAAPAASTAPAKVAALPQGLLTPIDDQQGVRLLFPGTSSELTAEAEEKLGRLAQALAESGERIQLKAYGGANSESSRDARRLSLARGLAVRSYLIEQGILSTRVDVRALGNNPGSGPAERVDVLVIGR